MVRTRFLLIIPALFLLWRCPAGPPTGLDTDISKNLSVNCLISPYEDTLKVFVSKWNELSEYEYEYPYSDWKKYPDYWSVSGAIVTIAVNGNYLPVMEDSVKEDEDIWDVCHYYYYKFPNVDVHPGQHWQLSVYHPDYDSLYAETVVPDSVEFINLPDTIRDDSENLNFSWTDADGARGYLPLLSFTATNDTGKYWSIQVHSDFADEGDGVYSWSSGFPSQNTSAEYKINTMLKEIKFCYDEDKYKIGELSQFTSFYLRFYVYSLNEALYNIQRWEVQPDELSGFNAPIRVFSNVEGGSGILGSFWRTASPKIIVDKEFLISHCQ
ncbi:MAG TPA: DUF4249 family protein [Candidatus Marinimicrobia bacterium]|nr:DUF4249 family protein [Candidatus Neomarinimicrobiota bacterium]